MRRKLLFLLSLSLLFPAWGYAEDVSGINWSEGYVSAVSSGTAEPSGNRFRDEMRAERAAIVTARRDLLEQTKGVRIDGRTLVKDSMVLEDVVISRTEGLVKNSAVVFRKVEWDGDIPLVTVEVRLCLIPKSPECSSGNTLLGALGIANSSETKYGNVPYEPYGMESSLPKAAVPSNEPTPVPGETTQLPVESPKPEEPNPLLVIPEPPVSGLVLNLNGLYYDKRLLPIIATRDKNGKLSVVYSVKRAKPEVIRKHGLNGWSREVSAALLNERLGKNIMVLPVQEVADDPSGETIIVLEPRYAQYVVESTLNGNDYLSDAKVCISER